MSVRPAIAVLILLLTMPSTRVIAQADEEHARAVARATCQSGKQTQRVTEASAALAHDPDDLDLRMRLADALVDQGCYQEAVGVLEAGQEAHPRSKELSGKLRDVRSLVTEQTYIEGLTQAAEAAKFQRNQLRCTRLADLAACEDALKIKPEDSQLLAAKDEAMKAKLAAARAVGAAQAAAVAQGQRANQDQQPVQAPQSTRAPQASPNLQSSAAAARVATEGAAGSKQPKPGPTRPAAPFGETPAAQMASLEPPPRTYSNEAPPGQTN